MDIKALIGNEGTPFRDFLQYLLYVPSDHSVVKRFGVAILFTAIAFGLRDLLGTMLMFSFPFGFFIPACLLATWFAGFGSGIAAMVAGALLGVFFFLEPYNNWGPLTHYGSWALAFHFITSSIGIILIAMARFEGWKRAQELTLLREQLIEALTGTQRSA